MAQFVKVASIDDLHHLYPNLQIDQTEGLQCMLQEDQIAQYTDNQGQQVIASIEQTGMQLSQNIGSSTQIGPHQQIVVHQPTQYIIQQMDANDHHTVHFVQQSHESSKKQDGVTEEQLIEHNIGSISTSSSTENSPLQQYIVKSPNDNHFVSQIQPIIHQPIQIHQKIQAVDMGGNILVLQTPDKQDYISCPGGQQEIIGNQKEKSRNQIFQKPQQKPPEKIQNCENTSQHLIHQQISQSSQTLQSGKQQEKIHSPQQIIHQLQYYNKITVLDESFQPNRGTGNSVKPNECLGRQYQVSHQPQLIQQQFRPQKKVEQQLVNPSLSQQSQHLLIPQLSSTPQSTRILHTRQKGQHETETSAAPVLIFQKLDGPLLIRQPQIKNSFQGSAGNNEKIVKTALQFKAKALESNLGQKEKNQELLHSESNTTHSTDIEQKIDLIGTPNQINKFSINKQQSGEKIMAIIEKTTSNVMVDQGNKMVLTKLSPTKNKSTEQQTEPISVGDNCVENLTTNIQIQAQTSESNQIHLDYNNLPNQVSVGDRQIDGPKKVCKAQPLKKGQIGLGGRNIQVQNSPPRLPNPEKGDPNKNIKFTYGVINSPRPMCNNSDINQKLPPRQGACQIAQPNSSSRETNLPLNENADEATMLVILLNGEKKRIKIPCTQQNILLGQILQQAGISSSPASISIEQNLEDCSSEHFVVKTSTSCNQTSISKSPVVAQFIPNLIATPRGFFATIQQQRPRTPVPRLTQTSNLGIVRQRLQISSPRLSNSVSAQQVISSTNLSSEVISLHPQLHQSVTPTSPAKEELPRYMPGYVAVCPYCGIQSVDFNKCIRCKRKLPENVKYQSIYNSKKKKAEKAENEKTANENKHENEEKHFDSPSSEIKERVFIQFHEKVKAKPKGSVKKKKISDEPTEILILSSDDEEEDHKLKKTDLNKDSSLVFSKEPVYLNSLTSDMEINNALKESSLSEDLMKNVQPGYFTTLLCRNIRIGSYKVQPKERVFVSSKGIRLVINSLKNENSVIVIPISNILKVLIHCGRQIPVIFVYPLPQVGAQIRSILGMNDKMGPYYDPASTEEESHKRITLLLEKITEDNKITLNKIFEPDKFDELSEKEANEILLRASPFENKNVNSLKPQESIRKIMVYPPPPEKGGITLNNQDYACLGEDQFLNDVIIDFYLKYLLLKVLSPEDRNRTHVFSTFFYKRLTTKPKTVRKNDPENDPKLSPAEKRHMRVKGWTKQVNLFEKDFIIVPINEHSHWFLAIICFPGLTGPVRFSDNKPIEIEETIPKKNTQTLQIGDTTITHIMKPDGSTVSLEMDSGSDRDEAEGDQDDLHPSSDEEESETTEGELNSTASSVQIPLLAPLAPSQSSIKDSKLKVLKRKPFKEPIKQPCILIFDSLAGASRVRVVATLRDYLKIEYKKKMGQDRDFTKDTIKGAVPKVPQQNNFTDCGLYVLQYVESFFQDPLHDFKLPLKYLQEWFSEEVVSNKRQKLARLIRTLMEEQGIKVEEIGLPVLTFSNESSTTNCAREEEDDEDEEEMNDENEEILNNRVNASDLDNDDDEDMDLEDDEVEEDEDDELDIGNIQKQWINRIKNSKSKSEHSMKHMNSQALLKNCSLVDYEASESEEEDCLSSSQTSLTLSRDQASSPTEMVEETEYCLASGTTVENEKNVPLTDLQDFESQITCTTIEKTYENKDTDCEAASYSKKYKLIVNEEETSLEDAHVCDSITIKSNCKERIHPVESRHFSTILTLSNENKSTIVADINKKLVKEKTIIPSRKKEEEESEAKSSFLFKNNLDSKLYIPKNCDKSEENKKVRTTFIPVKSNAVASKRTYQALKSIRIPKKAERNLEAPGKRQKVDET